MRRSAVRKTAIIAAISLAILAGSVPVARASIWTGSCALEISFSFRSPVRSASTLSHPRYDFSVSNALGLPCAVSLNVFQPLRTTTAGGSGSSVVWTCEGTLGTGTWNQGWTPSLPPVAGSHIITGTWGAWTMVVTSPSLNFTGVIELTVHPLDALKLVECETSGITSLTMLGVMVFQDPELPGG